MGEPKKIKTEQITFRSRYGDTRQTAVVRRNRTEQETRAQFDRLYDELMRNPDTRNVERVSSAYFRTMGALDATGRSIPGGDNNRGMVLISRKNNRK